jgi:hypothetical protein
MDGMRRDPPAKFKQAPSCQLDPRIFAAPIIETAPAIVLCLLDQLGRQGVSPSVRQRYPSQELADAPVLMGPKNHVPVIVQALVSNQVEGECSSPRQYIGLSLIDINNESQDRHLSWQFSGPSKKRSIQIVYPNFQFLVFAL